MLLTLSQISLCICANSLSFVKKDIHLVSSKFLPNALILGSIIEKSISFPLSFWYPIKHLKPILPKGNLQDTTILSMSTSYIEIRFLCWWNVWSSISVSPNFIISKPVLYAIVNFYNFFVIRLTSQSNQHFAVNLGLHSYYFH